jgi:nucleotide-binding universal stress UspA family protein
MERYISFYEEWIDSNRNKIAKRAQEDMDRVVEDYASRHISITPLIDHGPPPAVISEKTRTLDIDLIVIGKRGETELDDTLLGSVTKHVLYETICDVLIVSPATTPNPSG